MKYNSRKWIGQKFGRMTVIGIEHGTIGVKKISNCWKWVCKCDCGNVKTVMPNKLISGHTTSCGCYKSDKTASRNKTLKTTHGGRYERLYKIWHGMKQRCYWSGCRDYRRYGARGIEICDEWLSDYASFRNWALNNGYNENLSIDRIDVNGNYCPDNCRWATASQQQNNRRTCKYYDYNGEKHTIAEISRMTGIKSGSIYNRINNLGWSPEDAFSTPVDKSRSNHVM